MQNISLSLLFRGICTCIIVRQLYLVERLLNQDHWEEFSYMYEHIFTSQINPFALHYLTTDDKIMLCFKKWKKPAVIDIQQAYVNHQTCVAKSE